MRHVIRTLGAVGCALLIALSVVGGAGAVPAAPQQQNSSQTGQDGSPQTGQDGDLPPGVTAEGVDNSTALVDAHRVALNDTGATVVLHSELTSTDSFLTGTGTSNATDGFRSSQTMVSTFGEGVTPVRLQASGSVTGESRTIRYVSDQWANETFLVSKVEYGNRTQYYKQYLDNTDSPDTPFSGDLPRRYVEEQATGASIVAGTLQIGNFTVESTREVGEENLTTLRATEFNETVFEEFTPSGAVVNVTAANETLGNETDETVENETSANETADDADETVGNETDADETVENETRANETVGNRTQANETAVDGVNATASDVSQSPTFNATVVVDEQGRVRSLDVTVGYRHNESRTTYSYDLELLATGDSDALEPLWSDRAVDQIAASVDMNSTDRYFTLTNSGPEPVPRNTTVTVTRVNETVTNANETATPASENATHANETVTLTLNESLAANESAYIYYPADGDGPRLATEPPETDEATELTGEYEFVVTTPDGQDLLLASFGFFDGNETEVGDDETGENDNGTPASGNESAISVAGATPSLERAFMG